MHQFVDFKTWNISITLVKNSVSKMSMLYYFNTIPTEVKTYYINE